MNPRSQVRADGLPPPPPQREMRCQALGSYLGPAIPGVRTWPLAHVCASLSPQLADPALGAEMSRNVPTWQRGQEPR